MENEFLPLFDFDRTASGPKSWKTILVEHFNNDRTALHSFLGSKAPNQHAWICIRYADKKAFYDKYFVSSLILSLK